MKKAFKIVLGLALILAGILWALETLDVLDIVINLDGWWAFFVIIPCAMGLFTDRDKIGPCMGIGVGILLFLSAREVIDWNQFWQLALAVLIVGLGLKVIFGHHDFKQGVSELKSISRDGREIRLLDFSFGKQDISFSGERFEGADVKASFGSVNIDLRGAEIVNDSIIKLEAGFCGVVITVPENVIVKTSVSCGFGGVTDKRKVTVVEGAPTLFITGQAGFAGVEVR